ncbi:MAG TPA: methyltransferase domain-containing protein [Fimbriimonadaceae bacterium]|nr:methyltransferase domain-containing protein [Fimbriimonadaceae bacterium]
MAVIARSAKKGPNRMDLVRKHYPEVDFGGYTSVSGTPVFYLRANALLRPDSVVLDVGCGRGAWLESGNPVDHLRNFKGRCAEAIGIDVDEAGATNASLDRFALIENGRWPLEDASVDLMIADYVMEHIEDVDGFFREASRVLRPGGYLCIRTPNKYFYVSVLSRLIPNSLHVKLLGRVQEGRQAEDVFPTVYRCNTRRALLRAFERHGLSGVAMAHEAEPLYLTFNRLAFWFGILHQRFAPRFLRANLFAFAKKIR